MSDFINVLGAGLKGVATGLNNFATYSAKSAAKANAVSAGAQAAAAKFNQSSSDNANNINTATLAGQFLNNSAGASMANEYTSGSWAQAAAWNEEMFERQMEFNAEQARLQREWAERMDNTKYQRAMADMKAGGLNPILAYGGINSSASGSAASVSAPEMGFAHGAQPTQGVLGANDASISGYNGQMEYMGGLLGLLSAGISGISSAMQAFSQAGVDKNSDFLQFIKEILAGDKASIKWRNNQSKAKGFVNNINELLNKNKWANGDYNPYDRSTNPYKR